MHVTDKIPQRTGIGGVQNQQIEASRTTRRIPEYATLFYLVDIHFAGEEANGFASDKGLASDLNGLINMYRQRSEVCASSQTLCGLTDHFPHKQQMPLVDKTSVSDHAVLDAGKQRVNMAQMRPPGQSEVHLAP